MTGISPKFSDEDVQRIFDSHVMVGFEKPVSYLPIKTINEILGLDVSQYSTLVEGNAAKSLVVYPEACCIKSGAVYAYNMDGLEKVLKANNGLLVEQGWPTDPREFIIRIAARWLDSTDPVLPVVKRAFGDY